MCCHCLCGPVEIGHFLLWREVHLTSLMSRLSSRFHDRLHWGWEVGVGMSATSLLKPKNTALFPKNCWYSFSDVRGRNPPLPQNFHRRFHRINIHIRYWCRWGNLKFISFRINKMKTRDTHPQQTSPNGRQITSVSMASVCSVKTPSTPIRNNLPIWNKLALHGLCKLYHYFKFIHVTRTNNK
jgi:hypothetical protein